jgi:asparagine synthase (glutamine-hydrolysing)
MCGIAGIVSEKHRELGPLLEQMLLTLQHRGPDGAGCVIGGESQREQDLEGLRFEGKKGHTALGHVRLAITGETSGLQPFQSDDGRISLLHNGELYNFRELTKDLDSPDVLSTGSDSEVLLRLIEQEYQGDLEAAMDRVLPKLDGVYALAVTDQKQTIIVRDKIGVRQLYYCTGSDWIAFASEKKPLLALGGIGIEIHRVLPGQVIAMQPGSYKIRSFWTPDELKPRKRTRKQETALLAYDQVIREAVRKRVHDRDRVGVIFSGGVDSVLIAHLVMELGIPFTCYTAGCEGGSTDVEWARHTAEAYGFPLHVTRLSAADIDRSIPDLIRTIEYHSLNQVEVAVPIYASVRAAQDAGERVILTGQGADELFGGYPWYASIVDQEGYDHFVSRSWEDTFLLYKECLEREDKIAMAHGIELRVPFLDPDVIRVAFSIAPELKIQPGGDTLGKRIHRKYSQSVGVPRPIALRGKEAAQHGANIHSLFDEIARHHGLSASLMNEVGYDPDQTVREKLGSSSRYGYRYGQKALWDTPPHVQYYLDSRAAGVNLLAGPERYHWDLVRGRLDDRGIRIPGETVQ